jgi:hypothetical protein
VKRAVRRRICRTSSYKGWVIEAQSYKSDSGRWRPKALVSIHEVVRGNQPSVREWPSTRVRHEIRSQRPAHRSSRP